MGGESRGEYPWCPEWLPSDLGLIDVACFKYTLNIQWFTLIYIHTWYTIIEQDPQLAVLTLGVFKGEI